MIYTARHGDILLASSGALIAECATTEQALNIVRLLNEAVRPDVRNKVLDEIEQVLGAAEGRHFDAIGTAETENDKRRHGTKVAFAMELRRAIRALKTPDAAHSQTSPKGESQ